MLLLGILALVRYYWQSNRDRRQVHEVQVRFELVSTRLWRDRTMVEGLMQHELLGEEDMKRLVVDTSWMDRLEP